MLIALLFLSVKEQGLRSLLRQEEYEDDQSRILSQRLLGHADTIPEPDHTALGPDTIERGCEE